MSVNNKFRCSIHTEYGLKSFDYSSGYQCFKPIINHYTYYNKSKTIVEYWDEFPFSQEQIKKLNDLFNSWTLKAEFFNNRNTTFFTVEAHGVSPVKLLSTLVARRYLADNRDIIGQFLHLMDKYPSIDPFVLFQVVHYHPKVKVANSNHTFLIGNSPYAKCVPRISTFENFKKNLSQNILMNDVFKVIDLLKSSSDNKTNSELKPTVEETGKFFDENVPELIKLLDPVV